MKKLLFSTLLTLGSSLFTLCYGQYGGGHSSPHPPMSAHQIAASINGGLNQSYLVQNVCGLNYTQATILTETRTQTISCNLWGTGFPTTLAISGLPNLACGSIVKAYLYYGCTYTEATPPSTSATVTNPASGTYTIASVLAGTTGDDICWVGNGSVTYRTDITSIISGNGNYIVNLNGFANPDYEVDGVTLVIVYSDPSATYSGSMALWDGDLSNDAGLTESFTGSGFLACSGSATGTAFALMGDIQADVSGGTNTENYNGDSVVFPNNFWNYCDIPVTLTAGQSTLTYNTYTNNTSDCYFIGCAGLYWQNTNCMTCTPTITTMTLTTASAPASCGNNGQTAVTVVGATGPLTYIWSPSGQTTATATGLPPGFYTVDVSDGSTCAADTVTVGNLGMTLAISNTDALCNTPGTASISVTGGTAPYTYLWSNSMTTSSITAASGTFTLTVTDNNGCTLTDSTTILNLSTLGCSASSMPYYSCPSTLGSASVIVSAGTTPYTYLWTPGGQTTAMATGLSAGTYTINVIDSNGCTTSASATVTTISSSMNINMTRYPYYCPSSGGQAIANGSGGTLPYTYSWSPGGQTNSAIGGLSVGIYTVTVSDSNGCSVTDSVSVSSAAISFTVSGSPAHLTLGDSTLLSASCNVPGSLYSWTPSASVTNPSAASSYATPTVTTTYTCTATTPCGTYTDTVTIYVGCFMTLSMQSLPYYCSGAEGSAKATPASGVAPFTYTWSPGGQTSQTATGLSAGTYSVTVYDANGCSQTSAVSVITDSVTVFAYGATSINAGDSTFIYATCDVSSATFSWAPAASCSTPNAYGTYVDPSVITTYTVTATTPCGTYTNTVNILINCTNNYNVNICIVTIDTATGRNEIIWDRAGSPPDGSYNIYKETTSASFSLIATQPLTSLSDYIDTSSRPWLGSSTYEVATVDSCGVSSLSAPHTSIYMTDTAETNVNVLNWTAYVGFSPAGYLIYRGSNLGNLVKIDSVGPATFTYHDTIPPSQAYYMIGAINPNGACFPTLGMVRSGGNNENYTSLSNRKKVINLTTTEGIQSISSVTNLSIYPNPSNGQITLEWSVVSGQSSVRISIYDELGQIVYDNNQTQVAGKNSKQINLESLASGIYTLRMQSTGGTAVRKVELMKK